MVSVLVASVPIRPPNSVRGLYDYKMVEDGRFNPIVNALLWNPVKPM